VGILLFAFFPRAENEVSDHTSYEIGNDVNDDCPRTEEPKLLPFHDFDIGHEGMYSFGSFPVFSVVVFYLKIKEAKYHEKCKNRKGSRELSQLPDLAEQVTGDDKNIPHGSEQL
jgi:hypothetical protein